MANISFIGLIFPQFSPGEWRQGVSIYRAGGVSAVSIFGDLVSAKARGGIGEIYEVRLKLHGGGKGVQWMECTCQAYRRKALKCSHLAALCLSLDQDHASVLSNRALGAGDGSRFIYQDFTENDAANKSENSFIPTPASLPVDSLRTSSNRVLSLDWDGKTHCGEVCVLIGPGNQSIKYSLNLDDLWDLLEKPELHELVSPQLRRLVKSGIEARRVFNIKWGENGAVQVMRVVVVREGSRRERLLPITGSPEAVWGRRLFFHPKLGLIPFSDRLDLTQYHRWKDYPAAANLTGDQSAMLFESGFAVLRETAEVRLAAGMEKLAVDSSLAFSQLEVEDGPGGLLRVSIEGGEGRPSLLDVVRARAEGRSFVKTDTGWVKLSGDFDWLKSRLGTDGSLTLTPVEFIRFRERHAREGEVSAFGESARRLRRGLVDRDELEAPGLEQTKLNLRSYQDAGYRWLWWLYESRLGGLLCDDMGLGKTHQAMALMAGIAQTEATWQVLVVCPTSVIDHWLDKLERFVPNLPAVCYHGPQRQTWLTQSETRGRILVTSYGIMLRDIDSLMRLDWKLVVLDEAHLVKNQMTRTYRAAFRMVSRMRLCLTGTPLENDLMELKNIFDFLLPGYLGGDHDFKRKYMAETHEKTNVADLELQRLLYPFKMRRNKADVLTELPEKVEDVRVCHLRPEQKRLYEEALALRGADLINQLENSQEPVPYIHVFAVITLLKQICDDPGLIDPRYEQVGSGKLEVLDELLDEALAGGQKVVIFSQYARMIERLSVHLTRRSVAHVTLTGSTTHRGRVVREFQENSQIKVFLGSLLAGGTGIDLTAASVVVHFDRWWNAAKENQATDRIHRIGQDRNVQVYKLITRGTLEERIDQIISRKREIFDRYVDGGRDAFRGLSRQDLLALLAAPNDDSPLVDVEDDHPHQSSSSAGQTAQV